MNSITDRVIAYRLPQNGAGEEAYGLCLRREGNTLRVMLLQEENNYERPLRSVLCKLSDVDAVVSELENRFQSLRSSRLEENDAARQKKCRLQKRMLQWAIRRLEGVEEKEWALLSQQPRPSAMISAVGCTVSSIAAGKSLVSSTWADAQRLLRSGKEMVLQLRQVGEQRMERSLYDSIEETYLSDSTLSYSSVSQESLSLGILHKWITAFMDYQRACYMEGGSVELQQQLISCQSSLESARERRSSLAKQADLIKKGHCYSRTQTIHSVPIEYVLHLMTSEKVTTRQYLLKERVHLESLEEALVKSLVGPQNAHGCRNEKKARMTTLSSPRVEHSVAEARHTDRTPIGASTHPSPKAESARTGTWVSGRHVRRPHASTDDGGNMDGAESRCAAMSSLTDSLREQTEKTHVVREVKGASRKNSGSPLSSGKAAVTRAMTTTTTATGAVAASFSSTTQADRETGESFPSREPSAPSASADAPHVLADVKNHFKNVQETLLACLEEYEQLEEKYSNTVEQSKQLLQTLEERDDEIARLREDLSRAAQKQLLANRVISLLQRNQLGASSGGRCNGPQNCSDEVRLQLTTSSACDAGTFAKHVEYLLDDTLDFVRGAAAAPVV
ncbi:hypothetical protein LMJF_34_2550 [Leishmania major strain Friedlin]|uniref:Uncharacterized protein n=1 Tax=Leishmania major TaxID=5664 RepID=Q4Q2U0_LEIMA|nr:hypothetical protein LMJF_34_2550 [Leishmania major strain Friedlin]CAG9582132.1 hypothetical_protein_-_conserved [Leishmania major strain Friedlin]CAJ07975.1 hypothetical protein LMJF_34_2550 [Leishmania major strain Friedlin]|eukprot:XP_001686358.1 hypothetical protein LMJF_34_2550 [Leishmania major strain Friedlin]